MFETVGYRLYFIYEPLVFFGFLQQFERSQALVTLYCKPAEASE